MGQLPLALMVLVAAAPEIAVANWDAWWTYDGISGPSYWGIINPAWTLCNKGHFQSPINIDPREGHRTDISFQTFCSNFRETMLEPTAGMWRSTPRWTGCEWTRGRCRACCTTRASRSSSGPTRTGSPRCPST